MKKEILSTYTTAPVPAHEGEIVVLLDSPKGFAAVVTYVHTDATASIA